MVILPYRRPLIEIEWRILMVASNLAMSADRHGVEYWRKSDAFEQLDPSEKGAVSYFLGMTQAQVTCRRRLGIPLLAHLDTLLKLLGTPLVGKRPDFVGVDFSGVVLPVVVESKGRTGAVGPKLLTDAKAQALAFPHVAGSPAPAVVVSGSGFRANGTWTARLHDPPDDRAPDLVVSRNAVIASHYLPLVEAVREAPTKERREGDWHAALPGIDANFIIPDVAFKALSNYSLGETYSDKTLAEAGATIANSLASRKAQRGQRRYVASNGVGLHLGPSWHDLLAAEVH
ncbi:hypothetical protein GCM10025782_26180 [Pedococcus ginsenosidimutans]|uniref:Restriction endonuclease n=1 Tax=Pedococcus ginsenosidimutans TaxID=490570 RepID=A0ABP8YCF5_9MICO